MNEIEKRRLQLLQETRKLYHDKGTSPAIHPRYGAVYHSLYENEEHSDEKKGTVWIRIFIAVLLFTFVYLMDVQEETFGIVDSQYVIEQIQMNLFSQ